MSKKLHRSTAFTLEISYYDLLKLYTSKIFGTMDATNVRLTSKVDVNTTLDNHTSYNLGGSLSHRQILTDNCNKTKCCNWCRRCYETCDYHCILYIDKDNNAFGYDQFCDARCAVAASMYEPDPCAYNTKLVYGNVQPANSWRLLDYNGGPYSYDKWCGDKNRYDKNANIVLCKRTYEKIYNDC